MGMSDRAAYPPEPWDLHGHAYVGVWLLPAGLAPPPPSPRTPAIRVFGRVVVAAAFFRYDEPSPLTYDEIMTTVLVREGWRPRVAITHIWVDSEASRDGGRALWAIPKDLAEFDRSTHVSYVAHGIGALTLRAFRRLPVALPVAFRIAQDRDRSLVVSSVRGSGRLGVGRGAWSFAADGPAGFLAERRPLLTLGLRPFHLVFGRSRRPDGAIG